MNFDRRKIIRLSIGLFLFCIIVISLLFISNLSRIKIVMPDGTSEASIKLINTKGLETQEFSINKTTSKLTNKGSYNLYAISEDGSYISNVEAGGFFKETTITLSFEKESGINFLGANAENCVVKAEAIITYACGGSVTSLKVHIPGNDSTPGTANNYYGDVSGIINGSVTQSNGAYILVQNYLAEEPPVIYSVNTVNNKLVLNKYSELNSVNSTKKYSVAPYLKGMLVYSEDLTVMLYIDLVSKNTQSIAGYANLIKEDQSVSGIETDKEVILVTLNNALNTERITDQSVIIRGSIDGPDKSFNLSEVVSKSIICGNESICALNKDGVSFFEVENDNLRKIAQYVNLSDFAKVENELVALSKDGVMSINTNNGSGRYLIKFPDDSFKPIGLYSLGEKPYLLLTSKTSTQLVSIDMASRAESVLSALSQLEGSPFVKTVTLSNKYIYVSPDVGDIVYDNELRSYGFSKERRSAASTEIDRLSKELKLENSGYTLINLLP